jgi:glycylpeptide N-tetradecanoyltransferase
VYKLLNDYLNKFEIRLKIKEAEVAHWLLPREGVFYSYVVENPESKHITDLFSFYRLPSSILKKSGHSYDHVNVRFII